MSYLWFGFRTDMLNANRVACHSVSASKLATVRDSDQMNIFSSFRFGSSSFSSFSKEMPQDISPNPRPPSEGLEDDDQPEVGSVTIETVRTHIVGTDFPGKLQSAITVNESAQFAILATDDERQRYKPRKTKKEENAEKAAVHVLCGVCQCCKTHFRQEFQNTGSDGVYKIATRGNRQALDWSNFWKHLKSHYAPNVKSKSTSQSGNALSLNQQLAIFCAESATATHAVTYDSFANVLGVARSMSDEEFKRWVQLQRPDRIVAQELRTVVQSRREAVLQLLKGKEVTLAFDCGTTGWYKTKFHDCAVVLMYNGEPAFAQPWLLFPVVTPKEEPEGGTPGPTWSKTVADALWDLIKDLKENYGIKVVAIVSDNAAYCISAKKLVIQKCDQHFVDRQHIILDLSCAQHTLQLACQDITAEHRLFRETIPQWLTMLEETHGEKPARFVAGRITAVKWNSLAYATQGMYQYAMSFMTETDRTLFFGTGLPQLVFANTLLSAFVKCSMILQRDNCSPFEVATAYFELLQTVDQLPQALRNQSNMKTILYQRWQEYLQVDSTLLAIALHPEFPWISWEHQAKETVSKAMHKVGLPLLWLITARGRIDLENELESELTDWFLKRIISNVKPEMEDCVDRYRLVWNSGQTTVVKGGQSSLVSLRKRFPLLSILADALWQLGTNESCCERVFGAIRRQLTPQRCRMSHATLQACIFARTSVKVTQNQDIPFPLQDDFIDEIDKAVIEYIGYEDAADGHNDVEGVQQAHLPNPVEQDGPNHVLSRMMRLLFLPVNESNPSGDAPAPQKRPIIGGVYCVSFHDAGLSKKGLTAKQYAERRQFQDICCVKEQLNDREYRVRWQSGESDGRKWATWDIVADWDFQRAYHMTGLTERALNERCAKRARDMSEDSMFPLE